LEKDFRPRQPCFGCNGLPTSDSIVSDDNPTGSITNSDLEMAGLLVLWLVMEEVCDVKDSHVALFSDNSPTVHWVQRLAAKHSAIAMQLIRALALRLQLARASPLTPMHIAGVNNSLTDIPSRSFGSVATWHCTSDTQLLTLFTIPHSLSHIRPLGQFTASPQNSL